MAAPNYLAALPSRTDAFTGASPTSTPVTRRYVPGDSDICRIPLSTSPTRSLVRALRAAGKVSATAPSALPLPRREKKKEELGAKKEPQSSRKRARDVTLLRLDELPKRSRQACLRVALNAACTAPDPPAALVTMRAAWQANPRARFRLTRDVRALLAASVHRWTTSTLTKYMERASEDFVSMPRAEMVTAVRFHLSPPSVYMA